MLVIGLDGTDYLPVGYDSWPVDDERTRVSMTHFYRMLGQRLASGGWIDLSGWLTPHGRDSLGGRPFGDGTPPGPVRAGEEVPNPLL